MIKDIVKGVAKKLANEFDGAAVYIEEVEQGFKTPCFSVECSSINNYLYRGSRYRTVNNIEIHYYSGSEDKREDHGEVMKRLFSCLELIDIPGSVLRGEEMKAEVCDNYLSFKVSYCCFYFVEEAYEKMGELNIKREMEN